MIHPPYRFYRPRGAIFWAAAIHDRKKIKTIIIDPRKYARALDFLNFYKIGARFEL
jgi:hypothetical protein